MARIVIENRLVPVDPLKRTLDDLKASGWQTIVESASKKECHVYAGVFSTAAATAKRAATVGEASALELLAIVCVPYLWPGNDEIFGPRGGIDALVDADLDLLKTFLPSITDPELQARIGDIL